jgi:hypothetical protein
MNGYFSGLASVDHLSQPGDVLIHSRSTTAMRRTISPIQKRQRMIVRSPAITMITVDISPTRRRVTDLSREWQIPPRAGV